MVCAVLHSAPGTTYELKFQFLVYSADGNLIAFGQRFDQLYSPDTPNGDTAHVPLGGEDLPVGYVIEPAKLPRTVYLKAVSVSACGTNGHCTQDVLGDIKLDACLATGLEASPKSCP